MPKDLTKFDLKVAPCPTMLLAVISSVSLYDLLGD